MKTVFFLEEKNRTHLKIFLLYGFLGFLCVTLLWNLAPGLATDSASYLNFSWARPPLYPLFLWLVHFFSTDQLEAVKWAQFILTYLVLLYARGCLKHHFQISEFVIFGFVVVVFLNLFRLEILTTIASEGLAFPLFVLSFFLLIDSLKTFNMKKSFLFILCVALLVLTRTQFVYLYVFYFILLFWGGWYKFNFKKIGLLACMMISVVLVPHFLKAEMLSARGHAPNTSLTGLVLLATPLILVDSGAVESFSDPTDRRRMEVILNNMKKYKVQTHSMLETKGGVPISTVYDDFQTFRNDLFNRVIPDSFSDLTEPERSRATLFFYKALVANNVARCIYLYAYKAVQFIGGFGIAQPLVVIVFSGLYRVIRMRENILSVTQILVMIALLIVLFNAMLLAITEAYVPRYFIYTDFIFLLLAIIISDKVFYVSQLQWRGDKGRSDRKK
jgi:hypothetical protein